MPAVPQSPELESRTATQLPDSVHLLTQFLLPSNKKALPPAPSPMYTFWVSKLKWLSFTMLSLMEEQSPLWASRHMSSVWSSSRAWLAFVHKSAAWTPSGSCACLCELCVPYSQLGGCTGLDYMEQVCFSVFQKLYSNNHNPQGGSSSY